MSDTIESPEEELPPASEPEPPHRMVNGVRVPLTEDEIAARAAEEAAYAERPAPPRLIAKTAIYRRATDEEIDALVSFMASNATTPRQRLMWQDAEGGLVYVHEVLPLAVALFQEARAAELLAP